MSQASTTTTSLVSRPHAHPSRNQSSSQVFTLEIQLSPSQALPELISLDALSISLPRSSNTRISGLHIRNIPARQVHLLFSAPKLDTGLRSGFFVHVPPQPKTTEFQEALRIRWDAEAEELLLCSGSDVGTSEEQDNPNDAPKIFDYDALLALKNNAPVGSRPESEASADEWASLATCLTPNQLNRIIPIHHPSPQTNKGQVEVQIWPISTLSSSTNDSLDAPLETPRKHQETGIDFDTDTLHLTPISFTRTFPATAIGSERTKWARDRSWYLDSLIAQSSPDTDASPYGIQLLSELSLSFLAHALLGTYSCLTHWKRILALALTCQAGLAESRKHTFFIALLEILAAQLAYLTTTSASTSTSTSTLSEQEHDFLDDEEKHDLHRLLRGFSRGLREANADQQRLGSGDGDASDAETALDAVRNAFDEFAQKVGKMNGFGPEWDFQYEGRRDGSADVLGSGVANGDAECRGLGRRVLRMREGFGDGDDDDDDDDDGDSDGEEDDERPVVVDLEGYEYGDEAEVGKGAVGEEGEHDDAEDEDMDSRY